MQPYAQTNLQLFNQLRREGYSNTDLSFVRDACELTIVLYSGRFLPSGRPFIAHVVRTASILASLHLSAQVVAAGLLHNVYDTGDFGDCRRGISTGKRALISRVLSPEVEEYVARFPTLYWGSPTIQLARDDPDHLSPLDRAVLLILLADHLEHLLDLDVLYYVGAECRYYLNNSRTGAELAARLGASQLATQLNETLRETEFAELPVEIPAAKLRDRSFVLAPRSCRKRFSVALRHLLVHAVPSSRMQIQKLRLLPAELAKAAKRVSRPKAG